MSVIKSVIAREIIDSRGNPTVEVCLQLQNKIMVKASVPSGASTGSHEALELRDGDTKRYGGKGVLKAVANVNKIIAPKLIGKAVRDQVVLDKLMLDLDGTSNKSRLGANAILGVSMAIARAAAMDARKPLYRYLHDRFWSKDKAWRFPVPMVNVINGGAHAGWSIDLQECMILPQQKNIKEAIRCAAEIFQVLKKLIADLNQPTTVGDEGGYAPRLRSNREAFDLLAKAVTISGYRLGTDVVFGTDAAASEFYRDGKYQLKADRAKRNSREMITMWSDWIKRYPLQTIEDGLAEDDWTGWAQLTASLGGQVTLVGDDLFVTNTERLKLGIEQRVANAILIKLNQIGTVTETIDCIKLAQKNGYRVAISHRSGETPDDFIADLAVASGAQFIKTGSMSRGERLAKYNRLMEIWDEVQTVRRKK